MKKYLFLIMMAILVSSVMAFTNPQLGVCRIGDINGDCIITSTDYFASKNCLMFRKVNVEGNYSCSEIFDMNGDNIVTSTDLPFIKSLSMLKSVQLESCPKEIIIESAPASISLNASSVITVSVLNNQSNKRAAVGVEFNTTPELTLKGLDPLNSPFDAEINSDYVYNITESTVYSNGMTTIGINAVSVGNATINLKSAGKAQYGCNDINKTINIEILCPDIDGDGETDLACGGLDCNDSNDAIYSTAIEVPYDNIDQNCDSSDLVDVDADDFNVTSDCNDNSSIINPSATEICGNGIDEDCDLSDEACSQNDGGNEGGSSGGSNGGGSGGAEYAGNDKLHNGSILAYQFCVGNLHQFEFYAKNDGKVIIRNSGAEDNLVHLQYEDDYDQGNFDLTLYENKTTDLLNPNGITDSFIVYYKNSQTVQIPCFQIWQIAETGTPTAKTEIPIEPIEEPKPTVNVSINISIQEPQQEKKSPSWLWLTIIAAILLAALTYYLIRRENNGESVLREMQETDGRKGPKDSKKRK